MTHKCLRNAALEEK